MVRCLLLLSFFVITAGKSFGQIHQPWKNVPVIAAKDAYTHVGQLVDVRDSIYSGVIVHDTTIVCQIGANTSTPRLTMVYIIPPSKAPIDPRFLYTFQRYKIDIYGTITGSTQAPQIIVHSNTDCLRFFSNPAR